MFQHRTNHRHVRAAWLLVVTALGAAACGSSGNASANTTPSTGAGSTVKGTAPSAGGSASTAHGLLPPAIQTSGVLRVASSIGFPPFEFYGPDGKTFAGLDIDLLHALGPALGIHMNIIDTRYPNIPSTLAAGRADIAVSAFEEEPPEYATLSFVSYLQGRSDVLVSSSQEKVKPSDPTSLCGLSLGIVAGETGDLPYITKTNQQCKTMGKSTITVKTFQRTADALLALKSGQLDARVTGEPTGIYVAKNSNGALKDVPNVLQEAPTVTGIGVPKGQDQLLRALQAGMQQLAADGTYKTILEKWGVSDGMLSSFAIVPPLS